MKWIVIILSLILSVNAFADADDVSYTEEKPQKLKIESYTTEPNALPDPVDEPPVLSYAKPPVAATDSQQRAPASNTPIKYLDVELNVVCYYILPTPAPANVIQPSAPAISCVKLDTKKAPPAPTAPAFSR